MQPPLSAFAQQIRSSDCSLSLCANWIVTFFQRSANIEHPPSDSFRRLGQYYRGGKKKDELYIFLPPLGLPNANTITNVQHRKLVKHCGWNVFFWWGPNSVSGSQRHFCACVSMQSSWCVFKTVCDTLLRLPVYLPALRLKQYKSKDDSHPFVSCLLPESYWCRITKFPLKTTFISRLRKPNIKSLEAEINPARSYRQDLGFTKDCLSSLSLSLARSLTKIRGWRWMLFLNKTHCR